jgi:hypothetical protein
VWQRLYDKMPQWEQHREARRKVLAEAEVAGCTFRPELATHSKSPQK